MLHHKDLQLRNLVLDFSFLVDCDIVDFEVSMRMCDYGLDFLNVDPGAETFAAGGYGRAHEHEGFSEAFELALEVGGFLDVEDGHAGGLLGDVCSRGFGMTYFAVGMGDGYGLVMMGKRKQSLGRGYVGCV